jgi:flavorubredoxin
MEQMRRTPAAAFVCDGETDGAEEALLSIEKMLFYYFSFKYVCKGVVCKGKPSETKLQECRKLGQRLAKAVLSSARSS